MEMQNNNQFKIYCLKNCATLCLIHGPGINIQHQETIVLAFLVEESSDNKVFNGIPILDEQALFGARGLCQQYSNTEMNYEIFYLQCLSQMLPVLDLKLLKSKERGMKMQSGEHLHCRQIWVNKYKYFSSAGLKNLSATISSDMSKCGYLALKSVIPMFY